MYISQPCDRRVHRNTPADIIPQLFFFIGQSPNCWKEISNTNIYLVIYIFVLHTANISYWYWRYIISTSGGYMSGEGFLCGNVYFKYIIYFY